MWTGTFEDGTSSIKFAFRGSTGTIVGNTDVTTGNWVNNHIVESFTNLHRVYGYSEVLTVPGTSAVPEPASVTAWCGLALFGAAAARFRRRRSRNA